MSNFSNKDGIKIVDQLILVIQENKQYLSDIDGAIGDGDHGINMNKGFTMCREDLDKTSGDFTHGLNVLSRILMMKIGGSMGPLYGKFFQAMAKSIEGKETIGQDDFAAMLQNIMDTIKTISPAKVGDKTLIDTLAPAVESFKLATQNGKSFAESLHDMKNAAIAGRDSTKDMLAKLGRASRLGERSRGVLDAGATSCCLILCTMAGTVNSILK